MKEIPIETGAYYIFDRGYNNFKELYRIHRMESFFVVRAKTNLQYKCVKWIRRLPKGILTDAEIELTVYGSQKGYPEHLRLVRFYDNEQQREFMFLTNATELTALQVADLYKNRWQIELFFKWHIPRTNHFLAIVFHHYPYNIHCRSESTVIVTLFRRILSFFYNYILTIAIKVLSLQQLTKITIYTIFYEKMFSCNNYALHGSYF